MFCKNCGTEINGDTAFCSNCGVKIENGDILVETPVNQHEKKNNKIIGIGAIILVALAVIIGLGSLVKAIFFADNYEDVARKYITTLTNCDVRKAYDYCIFDMEEYFGKYIKLYCDEYDVSMDEFYENFEDEYDITVKSYKDILKGLETEMKENLRDEYGDYKISVKVVDSKELTKRELSDAVEDIREDFEYMNYSFKDEFDFDDYIDENKIKKGYEVDVKMTIDGEDDYDSDIVTLTIVKYKGKWKVLTLNVLDMD